VNAVINLRVPQNAGNSWDLFIYCILLIPGITVCFSGRLLHEVSVV
jgi:hypothetical protein